MCSQLGIPVDSRCRGEYGGLEDDGWGRWARQAISATRDRGDVRTPADSSTGGIKMLRAVTDDRLFDQRAGTVLGDTMEVLQVAK